MNEDNHQCAAFKLVTTTAYCNGTISTSELKVIILNRKHPVR